MKFAKAFFDSQFGISSPFSEEEFHQAIEYQKELVKRNIEESQGKAKRHPGLFHVGDCRA